MCTGKKCIMSKNASKCDPCVSFGEKDDDFDEFDDNNASHWDDITIDIDKNNQQDTNELTCCVSNPESVLYRSKSTKESFNFAYEIIYRDSDLIFSNKALAMSTDKIFKAVAGYFIIKDVNPINLASIVTKYISNCVNKNQMTCIIKTRCSQKLDHYTPSFAELNPVRKFFLLNMPMTCENIDGGYDWNADCKINLQLISQPKTCTEIASWDGRVADLNLCSQAQSKRKRYIGFNVVLLVLRDVILCLKNFVIILKHAKINNSMKPDLILKIKGDA